MTSKIIISCAAAVLMSASLVGTAQAATPHHKSVTCITIFGVPFCGTSTGNVGNNNNIGKNCPAYNSIGCQVPKP